MEEHFGFVGEFSFASVVNRRLRKKLVVAGLPEVVIGHLRLILPYRQVTLKSSSEGIVLNSEKHKFVQDMMLAALYQHCRHSLVIGIYQLPIIDLLTSEELEIWGFVTR